MNPFLIFTLCFSTALILGCAEERAPIDRVQPYALDKAFFVGESYTDTSDDPEFWTQATLIDVGYGASQDGLFTSTYAQPMSRIKWQITEDLLIGRISYERIDNSDGKGLGGPVQDGVIAVAFRILSHFDIERVYNPTTGERLNIVQENVFDRPWFERTHMRVDWSRNLNVDSYDFDTLSLLGIYGGIRYEPLSYDVTDPNHPNAPVFDFETHYFDVTTKAFAAPQALDLSRLGWGINSFPACFLPPDFAGGTAPVGNCNPVELTIRHSFRRVVDTDYEPKDWDGYRFKAYGAFTVERRGYTRNYRMTDDRWYRFISRYNLWYRSHYYANEETMTGDIACYTPDTTQSGQDPNRDEDGNGTADECEAVGDGSQCDTFRQQCTLPYRQRTVRPIVWYFTQGSDSDYFEATKQATLEWDVALRTAVRSAQLAECQSTGGRSCQQQFPMFDGQQEMNDDLVFLAREYETCMSLLNEELFRAELCRDEIETKGELNGIDPAVISIAAMPSTVVLCHSPVEANDPAECAGERLPVGIRAADCEVRFREARGDGLDPLLRACENAHRVRPGDLRYHQINVIEAPQTPSPWGIYTDSEDPLTGETIAASINVWSWVNDFWAQSVVDQMRVIKGELSIEDVTEGEYIRNWESAAKRANGGHFHGHLHHDDVKEQIADFAQVDLDELRTDGVPAHHQEQAVELIKEVSSINASFDAASAVAPLVAARANQAAGTEFEAALMTPMVQTYLGLDGLPLTAPVMDDMSLLRGSNPNHQRQIEHLKEIALADRGACIRHEAPAPLAISGLADAMELKFGRFDASDDLSVQLERAEKIRKYIAQRAHTAVILHEMGHSIGLRHNFVSSADAMNYRPQYWQLRTENGRVTENCSGLSSNGKDCVGPRYYDPVTKNESDNLLSMFMHSSVMDYAGEITQDFMGLGAYDFAAARMFYGDTASVFKDEALSTENRFRGGLFNKLDNFGGILGFTWFSGSLFTMHYSALQNFYSLISGCDPVIPLNRRPSNWAPEEQGIWHPVLDGQLVSVDGEFSRCKTQKVDYVPWRTLRMPTAEDGARDYRGGPSIDQDGRIRVPYGFGTDSWADTGNLSVFRHDNGADAYELFDFLIAKQEVEHIFNHYRRRQSGFSVRQASSRTLNRYNTKLRDAAKGLGLYRNLFSQALTLSGANAERAWGEVAYQNFENNVVAAGMAFDHFARMLFRPEHGPHFLDENAQVYRSERDFITLRGSPRTGLVVPNGPSGLYDSVTFGGRPVENQLANDKGEYDNQYTINVGSYYEKLFATFLLTESVDNFISASRTDFVDARDRAVSLADLFPDGFRRLMAHGLTNDERMKGLSVRADDGVALTDEDGYPIMPLGWTTWWGREPKRCFPDARSTLCRVPGAQNEASFGANSVPRTLAIDSQVGWEQQKFMIAWMMLYLPENQQQRWIDQVRLWELGVDADPGIENRIELHLPTGKVYVAQTFGKEEVFGRVVQRGIAARVLEYANELLAASYEVDPGPDLDGDGQSDWFLPRLTDDGGFRVKYSDRVEAFEGCDEEDNSQCNCSSNPSCIELSDYAEVPFYLRQSIDAYQLAAPNQRGVY